LFTFLVRTGPPFCRLSSTGTHRPSFFLALCEMSFSYFPPFSSPCSRKSAFIKFEGFSTCPTALFGLEFEAYSPPSSNRDPPPHPFPFFLLPGRNDDALRVTRRDFPLPFPRMRAASSRDREQDRIPSPPPPPPFPFLFLKGLWKGRNLGIKPISNLSHYASRKLRRG